MKGGILSDTKKTTKQIALDVAKRIAQEPSEILKNASETIMSTGVVSQNDTSREKPVQFDQKKEEEEKKRDLRTVQALENEIKDIERNRIIDDIQKKILVGEAVYFENYPELTSEQIEMLKKQQINVEEERKYKKQLEAKKTLDLIPKRSRRFGLSKKQAAEKETTRTEKPLPPSG